MFRHHLLKQHYYGTSNRELSIPSIVNVFRSERFHNREIPLIAKIDRESSYINSCDMTCLVKIRGWGSDDKPPSSEPAYYLMIQKNEHSFIEYPLDHHRNIIGKVPEDDQLFITTAISSWENDEARWNRFANDFHSCWSRSLPKRRN